MASKETDWTDKVKRQHCKMVRSKENRDIITEKKRKNSKQNSRINMIKGEK